MNTDLVRAWRHIHRYCFGAVIFIEALMLMLDDQLYATYVANMKTTLRDVPPSLLTIAFIIVLLIISVVGVVLSETLLRLLGLFTALVNLLPPVRWLLSRIAPVAPKVSNLAYLFWPSDELVIAVVKQHRGFLSDFLEIISIGNIIHERDTVPQKLRGTYFKDVFNLFDNCPDSVLFWQVHFARQLTQERREVDNMAVDISLVFMYFLAVIAAIINVATRMEIGLWGVVTSIVVMLSVGISTLYWAAMKRRQLIGYAIGITIQTYMWGEGADAADRDAI